jgi:hypothetical protein
MDGAMADCGGIKKRAEARQQRRWRRPRYDMNKILNWGVFLGVLVSDWSKEVVKKVSFFAISVLQDVSIYVLGCWGAVTPIVIFFSFLLSRAEQF